MWECMSCEPLILSARFSITCFPDIHCCCCRSDNQDDENQFWSSNMMIIMLLFQDSGVWCYGRMTHRRNYYIAIIIRLFQAPGISPQMESCSQIRPLKDFSHSTREKKFYGWMTHLPCATFLLNSWDVLFSPTSCTIAVTALHFINYIFPWRQPLPFFQFCIFPFEDMKNKSVNLSPSLNFAFLETFSLRFLPSFDSNWNEHWNSMFFIRMFIISHLKERNVKTRAGVGD